MKILITGPLGHIGSCLIRSLDPGAVDEVVLVDDLSTQRYCSLFDLPPEIRYRFVQADICEVDFGDLLQDVDTVIHLAAATDAVNSFENRDLVYRVNVDGTRHLATACVQHGSRMLFPSTTSVYGTQKSIVDEGCSESELRPQSPYADSKLQAEILLGRLVREQGLQATILRFGTICGASAGMRFHTAVNKFCWQASVGEPLTVWRTAMNQMRPYLELGDAVRALHFATQTKSADGHLYNVVTSNATVAEILQYIREHIADIRVELVDAPVMNQLSYEVSSEKISELGFSAYGDLGKAVEETLRLLRGIHRDPEAEAAEARK